MHDINIFVFLLTLVGIDDNGFEV